MRELAGLPERELAAEERAAVEPLVRLMASLWDLPVAVAEPDEVFDAAWEDDDER